MLGTSFGLRGVDRAGDDGVPLSQALLFQKVCLRPVSLYERCGVDKGEAEDEGGVLNIRAVWSTSIATARRSLCCTSSSLGV